jgi:hypothetical protein
MIVIFYFRNNAIFTQRLADDGWYLFRKIGIDNVIPGEIFSFQVICPDPGVAKFFGIVIISAVRCPFFEGIVPYILGWAPSRFGVKMQGQLPIVKLVVSIFRNPRLNKTPGIKDRRPQYS